MGVNFGQNPNLNTGGYSPANAVVTNIPFNSRILLDGNYIASVGLPNAANVVNTNALNFYVANPFPTTETINVQLIIGASTGSNNSKNLNIGLQTTEDNNGSPNTSNWLAMPTLLNVLATSADNGSSSNPGTNVIVKLPPGQCKQYIRAQVSGEANGGTPAGNATIQVLF
jgi:hypothetical protein